MQLGKKEKREREVERRKGGVEGRGEGRKEREEKEGHPIASVSLETKNIL